MNDREEFAQMRWEAGIDRIVSRLDHLREAVERYRTPTPSVLRPSEFPDYYGAAQNITHEVLWSVANMSLDNLYSNAGDALDILKIDDLTIGE